MKTFSYIGAYLTHVHHNYQERMVYIFALQVQLDGFVNNDDTIQLPYVPEPLRDPFLHAFDADYRISESHSDNLVLIQSNFQFRSGFMVLYTGNTIMGASLLALNQLISLTM